MGGNISAPPKQPLNTHIMKKTTFYDEMSYILGVVNVVISTWLISKYPHAYWIWHCMKNSVLLVTNLIAKCKIKTQYFMLDFCYIVNYLSILMFLLCVLANIFDSFNFLKLFLKSYGFAIFRIAFTWVNGPLVCAIAGFRNSLVFHSADHMTILAVHVGPALAVYGIRWWYSDLQENFPDTFHFDVDRLQSASEYTIYILFLPMLSYVLVWAIPYFIFMFILADTYIHEKGYRTIYGEFSSLLLPLFNILRVPIGIFRPVVYMLVHASLCFVTFSFSFFLWNSFEIHTIYLFVMFLISVKNGAGYYFHVFADKYSKSLIIDQETAENSMSKNN